jgi:hypothetical protein
MMLDRPKLCIVGSGINGNGFLDFCSDAQGIEACEESHPRPTNLELKLIYVIRAPGAGINLQFLSTFDNPMDHEDWSVTWLFPDSSPVGQVRGPASTEAN